MHSTENRRSTLFVCALFSIAALIPTTQAIAAPCELGYYYSENEAVKEICLFESEDQAALKMKNGAIVLPGEIPVSTVLIVSAEKILLTPVSGKNAPRAELLRSDRVKFFNRLLTTAENDGAWNIITGQAIVVFTKQLKSVSEQDELLHQYGFYRNISASTGEAVIYEMSARPTNRAFLNRVKKIWEVEVENGNLEFIEPNFLSIQSRSP